MDLEDFFKDFENEKVTLDYKKYLIHLLSYHILNQQYLKAILEAQVETLVKVSGNPQDFDITKHLKIIEDKIDKASDEEFIEAMQRIINKD